MPMNLFYSVSLKLIGLCCNLNGSFNHKWFSNMIHLWFGKSLSSEICTYLNWYTHTHTHFIIQDQKIMSCLYRQHHVLNDRIRRTTWQQVSVTLSDILGHLSNLSLKKIVLKKIIAISKEVFNTHYYQCWWYQKSLSIKKLLGSW